MIENFSKQPSEIYSIGIEFDGKLPSGASLSTGAVAAFDPSGMDVSAIVLASTIATISGTQALAKVQAGAHGVNYRLRFQLTLTNGDVLEEDLTMAVANL